MPLFATITHFTVSRLFNKTNQVSHKNYVTFVQCRVTHTFNVKPSKFLLLMAAVVLCFFRFIKNRAIILQKYTYILLNYAAVAFSSTVKLRLSQL